jgi:hypothetical protein
VRYSVIDLPCTAENVQERMNSFLGHAVFGYLGLRPFFAAHRGGAHRTETLGGGTFDACRDRCGRRSVGVRD